MFPVLSIGSLAIQTSGLIIIFGLWLGLNLSEKYVGNSSLKPQELDNLVMITLLFGIIGGRLVYILHSPSVFLASPVSMISLNPNLLDSIGGLAAGLLAGFIYTQHKSMQLYPTLDALTPLIAVSLLSLGLVHFANGNAYGTPTTLPWAIMQWGTLRHPSQIYESLTGLIVLIIVIIRIKTGKYTIPGSTFFEFSALTAGADLFILVFRGDSQLSWAGFRSSQLIAWFILTLCLVWFIRKGTPSHGING
jgi:phosphatidylglycerol:prolipoprotein diacylglycerol transferase